MTRWRKLSGAHTHQSRRFLWVARFLATRDEPLRIRQDDIRWCVDAVGLKRHLTYLIYQLPLASKKLKLHTARQQTVRHSICV